MKLRVFDTSIVVLAEGHNPTILHPAFLTSQDIVPQDWQLAEDPVCTPAASLVKYDNGIQFSVQSNRLQVFQAEPPENVGSSEIPALADRYIKTLPHVRYKAVGVNMRGFFGTRRCRDISYGAVP